MNPDVMGYDPIPVLKSIFLRASIEIREKRYLCRTSHYLVTSVVVSSFALASSPSR
jgi:gluconate kinase